MKGYALRVLVALDQLGNAILNGDEDETISSRAAKAARLAKPWGISLCWFLDLLDPGHCERVIECDEGDSCGEDVENTQGEGNPGNTEKDSGN